MNSTEALLDKYLTDELYDRYWDAVEQLGSKDLVIYLNESRELIAVVRQTILANPRFPEVVKNQILKPPYPDPAHMQAAFWFLLALPEGIAVASVNANRITKPIGTA